MSRVWPLPPVNRLAATAEPEQDWDDLPIDRAPAHATRPARPTWITLIAIVLVLNGISLVLYAAAAPSTPAWAPDPLPVIGGVTGIILSARQWRFGHARRRPAS